MSNFVGQLIGGLGGQGALEVAAAIFMDFADREDNKVNRIAEVAAANACRIAIPLFSLAGTVASAINGDPASTTAWGTVAITSSGPAIAAAAERLHATR